MKIVGSDIPAVGPNSAHLEEAFSVELKRSPRTMFEEEILEFESVEILAENDLLIGLRLDRPGTS